MNSKAENKKVNDKVQKNTVGKRTGIIILSAAVLLVIAAAVIFAISGSGSSETGLMITDKDGNEIIERLKSPDGEINTENADYFSFIDIAISEAVSIIEEKKGLEGEKALRWLIKNGCTLETVFDKEIFPEIVPAYFASEAANSDFGFVMTDISGRIICTYSSSDINNFAVIKTQPYSSIKPLSVYAPAIESGLITYSSVFFDSPYKTIVNENGQEVEWPQNGTGYFSHKDVSIRDAVKLSLNTIAVKCLKSNSAYSSLDFLQNKLGADVSAEAEKFNVEGEEEVLSQLALGYLIKGFSPVEMAGFYQMFGTLGKITEPYAVVSIKNANGKVIYNAEPQSTQVISEETAYIMNKLLAAPLERDGTAARAAIPGVPIIGKTGTGDDYLGCWFVGLTPEYVFSLWHSGEKIRRNVTTDIFRSFASGISFDKTKEFEKSENVRELDFCSISGLLASDGCPLTETGYYAADKLPDICSLHN